MAGHPTRQTAGVYRSALDVTGTAGGARRTSVAVSVSPTSVGGVVGSASERVT